MKILLVVAPIGGKNLNPSPLALMEPNALLYIGAGVQENHDVKLIDLRAETEAGYQETLEAFQPDVIGSGLFTVDVEQVKQLCREAKKFNPRILTVVGGHHATVMPSSYFQEYIDVVVVGEGALAFRKICENHEKQKSFQDIPNIYYRKNGQMEFTLKAEHPPLDSLPYPARGLVSHLRDQYITYHSRVPVAAVRASVGCFFNCNFCTTPVIYGRKLLSRSVENILGELALLEEGTSISWVDDEFFLEPKRSILLAREIGKAGIKMFHNIQARSDTMIRHPECIEEWAKVGLNGVFVGYESHRENELTQMGKGTSVPKNEEVTRIIHANGIQAIGNFIVRQDYSWDDFKQLSAYIRRLGVDKLGITVMTPLPGTRMYEEQKENFITDRYDFFDLYHTVLPTRLPLKQFYKGYVYVLSQSASPEKSHLEIQKLSGAERIVFFKKINKMMKRLETLYEDYDERLW